MKKILIGIALLCSLQLQAQKRFDGGFVLGLNASQVDGDGAVGYTKPGLLAGVIVERVMDKSINLRSGMYYTQKGSRNVTALSVNRILTDYVAVPFIVVYQFRISKSKARYASVEGGIETGVLLRSDLVVNGVRYPKRTYDFRNVDVSGKVGGSYYFSSRLFLSLFMSYSLMNIRADNASQYHNLVELSASYKL